MRSDEPATDTFATPEFHAALNAAEVLLGYAAGNGLMPAIMPTDMVQDIVLARQAWQTHRVTAPVAIGFWIAYANLSKLTRPVTAASLRACEAASLRRRKDPCHASGSDHYCVLGLPVHEQYHRQRDGGSDRATERGGAEALDEPSDLAVERCRTGAASSGTPSRLESQSGTAFVNRAFEDAVEFSRKSQWLLQSASKLHFWFNPLWTNIDIGSVTFDKDNPYGITHLLISPATSQPNEIQNEIENQIKAYQFIRNYALALDKTDSIIYGGITTYVLPTVYALLGAFLYGFRLYSRLIRRKTYLRSAAA